MFKMLSGRLIHITAVNLYENILRYVFFVKESEAVQGFFVHPKSVFSTLSKMNYFGNIFQNKLWSLPPYLAEYSEYHLILECLRFCLF